jgi:cytidine deaminase
VTDAAALLDQARALLPRARSPYSKFRVGAALEDESGVVHPGVNVESASFGLTICAERNALFGALARGATRFRRIAIACDSSADCVPCGACRQVLLEHAPDLVIVIASKKGGPETLALRDLLPRPFLNF